MTKLQRINSFFIGLLMLSLGICLILLQDKAISLIMGFLALSLTVTGIKKLYYYFTMAKFMVGGDDTLIKGLILFDLGTFTATLTRYSRLYVMVYLLAVHAFSGFIDVLRALEAKRLGSPAWKLSLSSGIINIAVALSCVVFLKSATISVYIYSAGLIYSALVRVILSFRKTAVVYITPS